MKKLLFCAVLISLSASAEAQDFGYVQQWIGKKWPATTASVPVGADYALGVTSAGVLHCQLASGASCDPAASGGLPSGVIVLSLTSCPSGFTEVASLSGKMLRGTLVANGDVGTPGGNATITPTGTVSQPSFTGTSNQATSAVSAGTPAGTNGTVSFIPTGTIAWPASVPAFTGSALATHQHELPFQDPSASGTTNFRGTAPATFGTGTSRAAVWGITTTSVTTSAAVALSQAVSAGTPAGTITWPASVPAFSGSSGTVPAETFTGSAMGTHSHTLTPAGTVSQPTFVGDAIDPSPSYVKVIFCSAS
jgi:hypothetical protein